ncbi:type II secretion system F family protein [Paraburkholderia sp. BL21I4N1]|uniref:type II secretion system F family protein n=1 Tax=Paraburkholderia sp. BL21I4N1 TaxID=1938801 RepID=UPI000CFDE4D9|nr:type II secretion system F family protein [Paraburkholderia sp. BL21I4N1]PQV47614.1 tight adherence protein B [Paraburkholderia sp. BL21I4N1]
MSSAVLVVAALALLCAALALLLWQRSAQRKGQVSTERFIDSRMAAAMPGVAGPAGLAGGPRVAPARVGAQVAIAPQAPPADAGWLASCRYLLARARFMLRHMLERAGIVDAKRPFATSAAIVLLLCGWAGLARGVLAALVVFAMCCLLMYFFLTMRVNKRRQLIVRQLPLFLDGIVRLITLGNSVPAAFQAALQTTETPLRECLDNVSRMLRTGVEIDRALYQVSLIYGVRELELVGSVLRLSVKYGGRADVMLDRMASFMRDLEQAERELVAMSSETRLSSWVLGALPVGIGGFLIVSNPSYFASMWFDPSGRQLVYLAFALQVVGAWLLYRMASLRD